jgi:hypothetical protein
MVVKDNAVVLLLLSEEIDGVAVMTFMSWNMAG